MKKLFALVALLCCTLALCCAPPPTPSRARAPDVTTVTTWHDFELVLHVDTEFTGAGRDLLERSAQNIRRLTRDRARITLAYDLDFESVENLKAHKSAHHSMLIAVLSSYDIVEHLDAAVKGPGQLLAATTEMADGGTVVFLILDRIPADKFESTVTHEFGHVIGLPDLDVLGAVMSRSGQAGVPAPADWTPADVSLCRAHGYCE